MGFSLARKKLFQEREKLLNNYIQMYDTRFDKEFPLSLIQTIQNFEYDYMRKELQDKFGSTIQNYVNDFHFEFKQKYLNNKTSFLLDSNEYGKVNEKFLENAKKLSPKIRIYIVTYFYEFVYRYELKHSDSYRKSNKGDQTIPKISDLMLALWSYVFDTSLELAQNELATKKNFVENVEIKNYFYLCLMILQDMSRYLDKRILEEANIAEYVLRCIRGGNRIILSELNHQSILSTKVGSSMEKFASIMSFIGNEDAEEKILQTMASKNEIMRNELYNRYYYLCNRSKDAPISYEVNDQNQTSIDVSSIDWREDDINDFYKELKLLKKELNYLLAIRCEDNMLAIPKNISVPALDKICMNLNKDLKEEFGSEVSAQVNDTLIISNDINEKIEGIMIDVQTITHMKIFLHIMKIGKKLSIKTYTVFDYHGLSLEEQNKKVIALSKNISPNVSVWEQSIKDTILLSLQHILNSTGIQINNNNDEF